MDDIATRSRTGKDLDAAADAAARQTGRWYGRINRWASPGTPYMSCKDWFLEFWQAHPRSSPDGGMTIEHEPTMLTEWKLYRDGQITTEP
jgi:hypothetical protein